MLKLKKKNVPKKVKDTTFKKEGMTAQHCDPANVTTILTYHENETQTF
jgi:hypothetical protein